MKKYVVILTLLFIVLAAVAFVVVTGTLDIKGEQPTAGTPGVTEPAPTGPSGTQTALPEGFVKDASVMLPLMKTDFENVYYTMDISTGAVTFFKAAGGALTVLPETGSFDVKATCSAQELKAVIHYVEQDGRTYGCGLFTNKLYSDVMYYDYAFFKLTDMFENYRDTNGVNYASKGAKLLLLDVEKTRFYLDEKVYSEAFILNADHTTRLFLSNDQRVEGMDGREKTDYKMFTDAFLNQHEKRNVLFLSSRYYVDYAESGKVDIFTSGGSNTNIDNVRFVQNVKGLYFWRSGDDVYYFKDSGDGSFALMVYHNGSGSHETKETFGGDLEADYIVCGTWVFNRHTGDAVNVLSGDELNVSFGKLPAGFTADLFEISENGRFCAVRGTGTDGTVAFAVCDLEEEFAAAFTDSVFASVANLNVQNDGTLIVSVSDRSGADSFYQLIYAIEQ